MQNAKIKIELCSRTLRSPSDWLTMNVRLYMRVVYLKVNFIHYCIYGLQPFSGLGLLELRVDRQDVRVCG